MLRVGWIASIAAGLIAGAAFASPAWASSFVVDLTISYIPGNPIIPGNPVIPAGTNLSGTASFFTNHDGSSAATAPIDIGHLGVGGVFSRVFEPPDPCLAAASCQLYFSFTGLAAGFTSTAFPHIGDLSANIVPIILIPGNPVDVAGRIVAFDVNGNSAQVGTWDVAVGATPVPAALPLFAGGLGIFGLLARLRKRNAFAHSQPDRDA